MSAPLPEGWFAVVADTWTCLVCGEERPDAVIGVTHQPVLGHENLYPTTMCFHVRHCTDRPMCCLIASRPDWQRLRRLPR